MPAGIVLKNSKRQAVVKFVGPGTHYANLSSLLHANVGGYIEQNLTTANAVATISDIITNVNGSGNIVRTIDGSAVVDTTYAFSSGQGDTSYSQEHGFVLNPNVAQFSNANIRIDFGATTGTIILGITKGEGFNDLDLQTMESHIRGNFT
jgi:hypothetical protein